MINAPQIGDVVKIYVPPVKAQYNKSIRVFIPASYTYGLLVGFKDEKQLKHNKLIIEPVAKKMLLKEVNHFRDISEVEVTNEDAIVLHN